jgi:hypothetical protein
MITHYDHEIDDALLESMDDAIRSLLSQEVVDAFHSNLLTKQSIKPEEIPNKLPTVSVVLRKYFGPSAETIERAIAQRLYSKYGIEFRKNESYQLADYVKNARDKVKFAAPSSQSPNVNLPLQDDFDPLFLESVKEAIQEALGEQKANLAFHFLERDVPLNKLSRHLPSFYEALRKNFGKDSGTIETAIARKLYEKLVLEFVETPNTELGKYVERAFVKLSQREQQGFVNISSA